MNLSRSNLSLIAIWLSSVAYTANAGDPDFMATRIDMVGLMGQLLSPMEAFLKEAVKEVNNYLPGDFLSSQAEYGNCCGFGDFGAKAVVEIFDFDLAPMGPDQLEIKAAPRAAKSQVVRMTSTAKKMKVTSGIAATIGLSALFPISCKVGGNVDITVDRYEVDVDVDMEDREAIKFITANVDPGNMRVDISPILQGACSIMEEPIKQVFKAVSDKLTQQFQNIFSTSMTDYITNHINNVIQFLTPDRLELAFPNLLPGRNIALDPFVDFRATEQLSTDWHTSAGIEASLSEPAWRDGSKFNYVKYFPNDNGSIMPEPNLDRMFNLHVSSSALNRMISTFWYMSWSFAADIDTRDSAMCNEVEYGTPSEEMDTCPFPPLQRTINFWSPYFLILFFMFPRQMFTKFHVQMIIPPPRIDFVKDGMSGTGLMAMKVSGLDPLRGESGESDLARFSGSIFMEGGLPGLNYDTGKIRRLSIDKVHLEDLEVDFTNAPAFSRLTALLLNTVVNLGSVISSSVLEVANEAIGSILDELPSVLIPDLNAFPIIRNLLKFYLPVGSMKGVAATENSASYLSIFGDLGTKYISESKGDDDGDDDNDDDDKKSVSRVDPSRRCDAALTWTTEFNNPNAVFSCNYSTGGNTVSESKTFRVDDARADTVEEMNANGNWVKYTSKNNPSLRH